MNNGTADPLVIWDAFKCTLRGHCIQFSSRKAKNQLGKEKALIAEIEVLTQQIDNNIKELEVGLLKVNLELKEKELERLYTQKANLTYLGNRIEWVEKGERSTKYFLNMQYRNVVKKNVMKLIIGNKIIEEPKEILMEQHEYFYKLYSFQSSPREVALQHIGPTENNVKLTLEEKESCEGLITQQELQEAIGSFGKGKSPRADGIPLDVYQTFYESIKVPLLCLRKSCLKLNGKG